MSLVLRKFLKPVCSDTDTQEHNIIMKISPKATSATSNTDNPHNRSTALGRCFLQYENKRAHSLIKSDQSVVRCLCRIIIAVFMCTFCTREQIYTEANLHPFASRSYASKSCFDLKFNIRYPVLWNNARGVLGESCCCVRVLRPTNS